MEEKTNWTLWIILGGIVVLLLSCAAGALSGGLAGYLAGKASAQRVAENSMPFDLPMPREMPWPFDEDAPEGTPDELLPFVDGGALIVDVVEGSPAEEAGLRIGDVVVAVDGETLSADYSLGDAIAAREPGDVVTLTVQRGDREREVSVELGRHPDRGGETPWLGVSYRSGLGLDINPKELPKRFEFRFPQRGSR